MATDDRFKGIQSLERAFSILRCFEEQEELGLTEISQRVGLHKSTTSGLVQTLKNLKILEQNKKTERYSLGIELFRLATHVQYNLKQVCRPFLESLLQETSETVNLVIRDDDCLVYVLKMESPHSMRICTSIGQRLPLYCTGSGKAILAHLNEGEQDALLSRKPLEAFTKYTVTDPARLKEQLSAIRRTGYACDEEELEYGLVCVGAAVRDAAGVPVAGISVSGPSMRMTADKKRQCAALLKSAAGAIEKRLF